MNNRAERKAYIITGPTSGIGRATALEVAKHGDVVLVGHNIEKLNELEQEIEKRGGHAIPVLCDISDITSVDYASLKIIRLHLHIAGLINNAGINQSALATKCAQGWDLSFATNHLGPFVLTENLVPHMAEGASIVFLASTTEEPESKTTRANSVHGTLYIAAEAIARSEWDPGGSVNPDVKAYATSHRGIPVMALDLFRKAHRHANLFNRLTRKYPSKLIAPYMKHWSTTKQAALGITKLVLNESNATGIYYAAKGYPIVSFRVVRDPEFTARVISETQAFLATVCTSQ